MSYLLVYAGPTETETQRIQASTSALITLITIALWVLAVVARPYTWWKLLLIGGSVVAYVILFAWPFTRDFFALDPSNVAATTSAFVCGAVGIVLVEVGLDGHRAAVRRTPPLVRRRLLVDRWVDSGLFRPPITHRLEPEPDVPVELHVTPLVYDGYMSSNGSWRVTNPTTGRCSTRSSSC